MSRDAFGRGLVRHRALALIFILLLSLLAGLGIAQRLQQDGLPIDFTPQAIFIDQGPLIDRLREIEQTFGREDNTLLLMLHGPTLPSPAGEATLRALQDTLAADPAVVSVSSLLSTPHITTVDGSLQIRPVVEDGRPFADALALAAADPALRGLLVSADGQTTLLRVRLDPSLKRVADLSGVVHRLTAAAQATPLPPDLTLQITGVPFVRTEVVDMMMADEAFFAPLTALIFAITICLLFRRVWLGLGPLVGVLVSVLWAIGALMAAGVTFNILSILVPILVLVIGVADGIHIAARYREELYIDGHPEAAMGRTLHHMTVACFLTTFTTAAGFASLIVADTRVIRDFGIQSAIAVLIAWIGVMVVLPVWLAFLPTHRVGPPPHAASPWETRLFLCLDRLTQQRPRTILAISLLLSALALGIGSQVRPNSSILEMYPPDHPTTHAIRFAEENLSGIVPIFLHIQANEGDLLDPVRLQKLATLEDALQEQDVVRWTTSLPSTVSRIHTTLTQDPLASLPDSREAIAQELLLAEMSGDLPLNDVANEDYTQARILALCTDAGGRAFLRLQEHLQDRADQLFADDPSIRVDVTGDGLIASVGINRLLTDMISGVALVFVVILIVMWATLRDTRLAILSLVPNALPLLFTLATLRLMGADIQISNIISFTVAVGLAVDDTIHFLIRYQQERAAGRPHLDAVRQTFLGAGNAIVLTSILLVAGFGILATSDLTTTRHFGSLAATTLTVALLADLFLLPALLHLFMNPQKQ